MQFNRSSEFRKNHIRSQSARAPSAGRQRPLSGRTINLFANADTIETVYTSKNLSPGKKNTPTKILLGKGISAIDLGKYKRDKNFKASKSQE